TALKSKPKDTSFASRSARTSMHRSSVRNCAGRTSTSSSRSAATASRRAQRVVVVYDPHQNDWLIRLARDAARVHGLELVATEAEDLKTATRLYRDILAAADPARDVLWLPQDTTTVEDSAVLPLVLQEAWNRSLPVISS